jgi:hypothetical protein
VTPQPMTPEQAGRALAAATEGRRRLITHTNALSYVFLAAAAPYLFAVAAARDLPDNRTFDVLRMVLSFVYLLGLIWAKRRTAVQVRFGAAGPLGYLLICGHLALCLTAYFASYAWLSSAAVALPAVWATVVTLVVMLLGAVVVNHVFRRLVLRRGAGA